MDPDNESNDIHSFYVSFQEEYSNIDSLIEKLPILSAVERTAAIDDYLLRINHLSDKVKDAASYLPAYDQRKYSEHIKVLSDKLAHTRKALAPKQKFSFKSKLTASKPSTPDPRKAAVGQSSASILPTKLSPSPVDAAQYNVSIHSHNHKYLRPHPLSQSSSVQLYSLTSCFADFQLLFGSPSYPPSTIAVRDISDSILFLPQIDGPAHLTSIKNSVLVLACHQFRMHDTHDTDVYLLCPSRPIIEDCSGIRFAPLPNEWLLKVGTDVPRGSDAARTRQNFWNQVDDFKWLRSEHSPNWSVLPEDQRVSLEVWSMVLDTAASNLPVSVSTVPSAVGGDGRQGGVGKETHGDTAGLDVEELLGILKPGKGELKSKP
ncbi:tubulin binding cofactor C-domain-containing protein [Kalaharituber pfeilii]|nr:tubulin binding cofactor C-domain-containing protein [Kalaharituber pfeilii]